MSNDTPPPSKIDKKWLLAAILFVGTALYVIAVLWIGIGSVQYVRELNTAPGTDAGQTENGEAPGEPAPYPITSFITQALLVIGTALATHLGAYLGISINDPGGVGKLTTEQEWKNYLKTPEGISGILAATYFASLLLAIIFWAITGFSPYAGEPLQNLAYAFLGVFAGAMAALSKGE